MDDLYDEFGNYQGPPLSGSEVLDSCSRVARRKPLACCMPSCILPCILLKTWCLLSQDEDEEEELDEVEEAEDLEDAEEAANRRMDMTSEAVCVMTPSTARKHKKHITRILMQQFAWLHHGSNWSCCCSWVDGNG